MQIEKACLVDPDSNRVSFQASPNHGDVVRQLLLIIHYSASLALEDTVSWFMNRSANASAHLLIGRDGSIVQMVPFNRVAWHAGISRWCSLESLNHYSIGIEMVNAGKLLRSAGNWVDWRGRIVPDDEVVELTHKHETTPAGWHVFTEVQMNSLVEAAAALHGRYSFIDILGHDDVAPTRKLDPGPAFAFLSFRSRIMGRA
jgi:N-acetylmuramoyl-L-alanine amidase